MLINEQYRDLLEFLPQLNNLLQNPSFERIIALQKTLASSDKFQRLKTKDNKLIMLDVFCKIWIEEKKNMLDAETEKDIFWKADSLEKIEYKYQDIKYVILRIENDVPDSYIQEGMDKLCNWNVSGVAITYIIFKESRKKEDNIIRMYQLLVERNELIKAIEMLQYAQKIIPTNKEIFLAEANCWIEVQQWQQALNCLKKIKEPDMDTLGLIGDIEQVLANEKI